MEESVFSYCCNYRSIHEVQRIKPDYIELTEEQIARLGRELEEMYPVCNPFVQGTPIEIMGMKIKAKTALAQDDSDTPSTLTP